jgi:predicted dehydrogenase
VIGAGSHFQDRLLPALLAHGGVSVTSVCASRGPSARAAASKADGATATTSAEEVLRDPEVDAVIIATRHGSHAALALSALGAGKRVFLEKPLCTTEEELEELERVLLGSDDAFLMLGFNRRFSPHVQTVRTHLAERTSPLVMSYRVNAGIVAADHWIQDRQEGGGRVIGECCHFLDAMAALAGAPPVRTTALSVGHHPSGVVSDRCVISSQLSDGSVASLVYAAGDAASLGKERLEILGGDAAFVIDDFRETTKYGPGGRTRLQRGFAKGFEQEMAAFARACLEGGPSPTDPETVIAVTRATFDAMAAIRGEGGVST